ncbi:MAG: hypothetical protein H6721_01780 [Sandaracinus sp.]|nr:hypothetical protein [Sandaracinus sp.]MCB9611201.1 hypothetical protein [Sandaracinus sp.]MCB9621047.1 hypothetical protein [Sandaracinus sp.]MCB9630873.1 hypothetical protein [Sandaracinus sp.]
MRWAPILLLLAACGGPSAERAGASTLPRAMPAEASEREAVLAELGRRLYAHLAEGNPTAILFEDGALRDLLEPDAAERARAVRVAPLHVHPERLALLREAEPASLCIQGGAEAQRGDPPFALKGAAWVFERALVSGRRPGGQRVALWIEGTFVLTDGGFGAIALRRVEDPRWEHSDLELATCDVRVEFGTPQDVVVVTP